MQIRVTVVLALMLAAVACKRAEQPATTSSTGSGHGSTAAKPQQQAPQQPAAKPVDVGSTMPAYAALNLDGTPYDLAKKRDKVVLLNVWATWCGPCRYEIPELQELHEKYASRGVEVLGVSVDTSGVDSVRDFVAEQKKMTYPVILDADGKIADILQTSVLPTSVIVDRSGKIVWKKYGAIMPGDEELTKALDAAL